MQNNKFLVFVLAFTSILVGILGLFGTFLAYRLGYCKCFDNQVGASECKPSRKWL